MFKTVPAPNKFINKKMEDKVIYDFTMTVCCLNPEKTYV